MSQLNSSRGLSRVLTAILLFAATVSCTKENFASDEELQEQNSTITFTAGFASDEDKTSSDPQTKVAINIYEGNSKAKVVFTPGDYIYLYSKYVKWVQYQGYQLSGAYSNTVTLKEENMNGDGTATFSMPANSDENYKVLNFLAYDNLNTVSLHSDYIVTENADTDDETKVADINIQTREDAFSTIVAGRVPHLAWAKCNTSDRTLTFKNILTLIRYSVNSNDVDYVEFTGNNEEDVIGTFNINFRKGEASFYGGQKTARSYVKSSGDPCYIALGSGLDLTKGFTVKAFDKDGKVLFACRSEKEFKTTAGSIIDLGALDDRASLYALWQNGEDIEIDGVKYNKSTYGDGTLIKKGEMIPASTDGGVFFIKGETTVSVLPQGKKIFFISDSFSGKRAKLTFTQKLSTYEHNCIAFKNIEFETTSSTPLLSVNSGQVDTLVMDGCKVTLKHALVDMSGSYSIENLTLSGNDFIIDPSLSADNAGLILTGNKTDESTSLAQYKIQDNLFWSSTPREWHIVKSDVGKGLYLGKLNLSRNTFYHLYSGTYGDSLPKAFLMLGKLTQSAAFGANLVYTGSVLTSEQTPTESSPTAYLAGFYRDYTSENTQNLLESGANTAWYGTSSLLGGEAFYTGRVYVSGEDSDADIASDFQMQFVRQNMTPLTENPFTAIDPATGVYTLKETYKGYGATR